MDYAVQGVHHIQYHHADSAGFIALCRKNHDDSWDENFIRPNELDVDALRNWGSLNVYFSQNCFVKKSRRISGIDKLTSLFVDLDCYRINRTPEQIIMQLQQECFNQIVPDPSHIVRSGRGLNIIWRIEPVPKADLALWQAVQSYLNSQLHELGSDKFAIDASHVFRIDGSINSKSGKTVQLTKYSDYVPTLEELQEEYLPDLVVKPQNEKKKRQRKVWSQDDASGRFTTTTLHLARADDLRCLVQFRNGDVRGSREILCYLFRYWMCCVLKDPDQALTEVLDFNASFKHPLSVNEVIRATRSAEKAWYAKSDQEADQIAREHGYPGAGYNCSNKYLLDLFGIKQEDEVALELTTIISKEEKYRRRIEKRRDDGVVERYEYDSKRKEDKLIKLEQLRQLYEDNPKIKGRDAATILGVTPARITQLKKLL